MLKILSLVIIGILPTFINASSVPTKSKAFLHESEADWNEIIGHTLKNPQLNNSESSLSTR
jgi:hypothetical protein